MHLHKDFAGFEVRICAIVQKHGGQEAGEGQEGQDGKRIGEDRVPSGQNSMHVVCLVCSL